MTTIRPATSNDASAIAQVHISGWLTTYRGIIDDEFLNAMSLDEHIGRTSEILERQGQLTLVAEDDDRKVIAVANGGPERTERTDYRGELYGIYILEEFREQGIGKRLFHRITDYLLGHEFTNMLVWSLAENPYRGFYKSLGGRVVDERDITIGEQTLAEVAYGWDDLREVG